ncbi:hypothetical protein Tco_0630131 [Tanacetum coccineum]
MVNMVLEVKNPPMDQNQKKVNNPLNQVPWQVRLCRIKYGYRQDLDDTKYCFSLTMATVIPICPPPTRPSRSSVGA